MGLRSGEKRKNDAPRPFQWWLLLLGFGLGVVVTLVVTRPPVNNVATGVLEDIYLTATAVVRDATATAQGTPLPAINQTSVDTGLNPIHITATYIIQQATQTVVAAGSQSGG